MASVLLPHHSQAMAKFKFSSYGWRHARRVLTTVFRLAIIQNEEEFIYRHLRCCRKYKFPWILGNDYMMKIDSISPGEIRRFLSHVQNRLKTRFPISICDFRFSVKNSNGPSQWLDVRCAPRRTCQKQTILMESICLRRYVAESYCVLQMIIIIIFGYCWCCCQLDNSLSWNVQRQRRRGRLDWNWNDVILRNFQFLLPNMAMRKWFASPFGTARHGTTRALHVRVE